MVLEYNFENHQYGNTFQAMRPDEVFGRDAVDIED